jgi:membrane peptidoglycan carboxypeptidase
VTIYYADGSVMDKLTTGARTFVKSNAIPVNVRHAVEAAEDETFETNNGFDVKAIARTVFNQLTGGTGGASTITQEYIKVATGNNQHSISRKISEVAEAYKMTKTYTNKDDILAAYLNIVYFGRGAYGIESAAHAFYGVSAEQLTPEQAAMLAGMIQLPGYANDSSYEKYRFTYVWGRMAYNHWITPTEYSTGKFAAPVPYTGGSEQSLPWSRQLIVQQVLDELANDGWSESALKSQGAQIYTTIQPTAQSDAENSVQNTLQTDTQYTNGQGMTHGGVPVTDNGRPVSATNPQVKNTEAGALVSINPANGEIIAWYGGNDPKATQIDMAATPHQPGSSFKPYVFAAALETHPDKYGLNAVFPMPPNKTGAVIAGYNVHNSDGDTCSDPCTVKKAMTNSINTVFYQMGNDVGTDNVRTAAYQAGISKTEYDPTTGTQQQSLITLKTQTGQPQVEGGISIGQYPVRVLDQAQGYATFANNGMYIPAHFVRKVTDIGGQNVLYQFNTQPKPAFSADPQQSAAIARTVSDSLTDVAAGSGYALSGARPADTKTGTQNYVAPDGTNLSHNSDAWTIGFTPQVVTAVWFGHYDKPGPIFGAGNNLIHAGPSSGYDVYGREEPGAIWKSYMDSYLNGQPVEQFPTTPADIGGSWNFVTNSSATQAPPPPPQNPNQQSNNNQPTDTQTSTTNPFVPPSNPFGGGGGGGGGGGHGGHTTTPTTTTCLPLQGGCGPGGGGPGGGPAGG